MVKEAKKESKKVAVKETKNKKIKKDKSVKKDSFFKGVIEEMKKVHWPDKKYIIKYTIVTLVFVLVLALFFYLISALMSMMKVWIA